MDFYEHEQPGILTRVLMGAFLGYLLTMTAVIWGNNGPDAALPILIPVVILLFVLALFHSLTVRVTPNDIELSFGVGWIRRSVLIESVEEASITRTHWYNGWGIRWVSGGWLWNISGFDAIELKLSGGRRFLIGTDEPAALHAAIESAMHGSESTSGA